MRHHGSKRTWDVEVETTLYLDGVGSQLPVGPTLRAALEPFRSPVEDDGREFDYLEIRFRSKGYDDPGSMYGGADHLGWAPEGDDERTILQVRLYQGEKDPVEIPEPLWPLIENDPVAWKIVEDEDLPEGHDEPDYDAMRDWQLERALDNW